MPKAEDYLYPNQMIVKIDDYDRLWAENKRLRAEKEELIEMLATRTTHPEYVEVLRRYRPANETEA